MKTPPQQPTWKVKLRALLTSSSSPWTKPLPLHLSEPCVPTSLMQGDSLSETREVVVNLAIFCKASMLPQTCFSLSLSKGLAGPRQAWSQELAYPSAAPQPWGWAATCEGAAWIWVCRLWGLAMELRSVPQSRGPAAGGLRLPESLLHRAREMLRVAGWRCWAPAWGDAPTQTPFCWCECMACHCCCCVGRQCVCKYHVLCGDLVIIWCTSESSDRSRHLCFSMWAVDHCLPAWAWWTWSHFVLGKLCEGLLWAAMARLVGTGLFRVSCE